jgi:hypothetical protein
LSTMSTSTNDSDEEDVDDSSSRGVYMSEAERYYISKGNDKRVFICLCIGAKDGMGKPIIDLETDPWAKQPAELKKPKQAEHVKPEIVRRATVLGMKQPRPGQWNVDKCFEWLNENPVMDVGCRMFLVKEAARLSKILTEAIQEKEAIASTIRLGVWSGPKPYLRLVHCIIEDDIRPHYLRRDAVMSRSQLDSRNSDSRAPTAYELIAAKWNNGTFNPHTSVSSCHLDFMDPIDVGYEVVKHLRPATVVDIKDRLTDIRARLIRMIKKWERSGQGDGGRLDDDEQEDEISQTAGSGDLENITSLQLGRLEGRTQFALDSRQNFLSDGNHGKMNPWYLYFWEQADKYELLSATVTELTSAVGAVDANSVPAVVATSRSTGSKRNYQTPKNRKRRGYADNDNDDNDSMSSGNNAAVIGSALLKLGTETKMSRITQDIGSLRQDVRSLNDRIDAMKRSILQHKIDAMKTRSAVEKEMYLGFVSEYNDQVCDLKSQLEEVKNTMKELAEKLD